MSIHLQDGSVEDVFAKEAFVLTGDPLPDVTIEEMKNRIASIATVQDLADQFASVHNKFWYIEDDLYDYEEGSEEYEQVRSVVDAWGCMLDDLQQRVLAAAEKENLLPESRSGKGILKQIEPFMQKYGYRDGRGWWIPERDGCFRFAPPVQKE